MATGDFTTLKELRDRTGAGMVDCQNALTEANGDITQAVELLRKKGLEKAGKKADRTANEGTIAIARSADAVAVVALGCETDFVGRNADFIAAAQALADTLLGQTEADFAAFADAKIKNELTVKIGEKLQLNAAERLSGAVVGSYLHSNRKVAAAVVLDGGSETLATDLAMHVAASSPRYLAPDNVPADEVEQEKAIYREQMQGEGKPAEIIEKALTGKLNKFYGEVCLLKQPFVKDDSQTVEQILGGASITAFKRFTL